LNSLIKAREFAMRRTERLPATSRVYRRCGARSAIGAVKTATFSATKASTRQCAGRGIDHTIAVCCVLPASIITLAGVGTAWQGKRGEQKRADADAESPQGLPPRDGLGQVFGEIIELVVHNLGFLSGFWFLILVWSCGENVFAHREACGV
jgi:hypothetical protein